MRYFEEACYEEKLKIGGLKNQSVQLRVASNYSKNIIRFTKVGIKVKEIISGHFLVIKTGPQNTVC